MDKSRIFAKLLLEYDKKSSEFLFEFELFQGAMKAGLNKLMLNPVISLDKKKTIIDKLFKENLSFESKQFIGFLIDQDQLKYFSALVRRFEKLAKRKNGLETVEIVSAKELSQMQIEKIRDRIRQAFKIEPIISTRIDEKVLAGTAIKIGDRVYDNTINKQINDLYKSLIG